MESIQQHIDNIKNSIDNLSEEDIMEVINTTKPIIVLYYLMKNESFEYYTNKLPANFFFRDDNEEIEFNITIEDANFIKFCINKFKYHYLEDYFEDTIDILDALIVDYKKKNDITNLNIINEILHNNIRKVDKIIPFYQKPHIYEQFLMKPNSENDFFDEDESHFSYIICNSILRYGDSLDIIKLFYECSKKYPDLLEFNFKNVLECALVNGREKTMQFVLDNCNCNSNELYEFETDCCFENFFDISDTITIALLGNNIVCLQTVIEFFSDRIKYEDWFEYCKFAAVYSSEEILQYLIILKPYIVEKNENFYNIILQYALCNANFDNVKLALRNGAEYSVNMQKFINEYNRKRSTEEYIAESDPAEVITIKLLLSENFNEQFNECMNFIMNLN